MPATEIERKNSLEMARARREPGQYKDGNESESGERGGRENPPHYQNGNGPENIERVGDHTYGAKDYRNLKQGLREISSKQGRRKVLSNLVAEGGEAEKLLPRGVQQELDVIRKKYQASKKLLGQTKTLVKSITPWGMASLLGRVNFFSDWPYALAMFAAVFKDLLDIFINGLATSTAITGILIPIAAAVGALGFVIGILSAVFVAMMLILGNIIQPQEHDRTIVQSVFMKTVFKSQIARRLFVWIGAALFETFAFGANTLPMETIVVFLIYIYALAERKGRMLALNKAT